MQKKIGIHPHPFIVNYGGILQAYALKEYLTDKGHDCYIIKLRKIDSPIITFLKKIKRTLLKTYHLFVKDNDIALTNIDFINTHFKFIKSRNKIKKNLDAVIVGSDQVWRHDFAMDQKDDYFFGYAYNSPITKIAYAASFGVNFWGYNQQETALYSKYLSAFKAISVREDSAVDMCKTHFNIEVSKQLDPTLLLTAEQYDKIRIRKADKPDKYVFIYWLGIDEDLDLILNALPPTTNVKYVRLKHSEELLEIGEWIDYIADADYVITDSFHGTVFTLVYQKDFLVVNNAKGGVSRIESLLSRYGLEDHYIQYANQFVEIQKRNIDYDFVNARIKEDQKDAETFLTQALSDK